MKKSYKERIECLEKKVADLENQAQGQQLEDELLSQIIPLTKLFKEIEELTNSKVLLIENNEKRPLRHIS